MGGVGVGLVVIWGATAVNLARTDGLGALRLPRLPAVDGSCGRSNVPGSSTRSCMVSSAGAGGSFSCMVRSDSSGTPSSCPFPRLATADPLVRTARAMPSNDSAVRGNLSPAHGDYATGTRGSRSTKDSGHYCPPSPLGTAARMVTAATPAAVSPLFP